MKILRAEHLGMCFGVRDAIKLALDQSTQGPLTILGELVHNDRVLEKLRSHGIATAALENGNHQGTLMITAHGASDKVRDQLQASGSRVIEATCPLVHVAHRAVAAFVQDGFHPVIVVAASCWRHAPLAGAVRLGQFRGL